MKDGAAVRVVEDQIGSPTYAGDLAEALLQILEAENFVPGIFHYCNEGQANWFQFADSNQGTIRQFLPCYTYFYYRIFRQPPKGPLIP